MRGVDETVVTTVYTPQKTGLLLLIILLTSLPALFDLSREESAIGIGALVLLPQLVVWIRTRQLLVGDPIFVLGFMWLLAMPLPVLVPYVLPDFYRDSMWHQLSPVALDAAALWMYRGWAACCVTYWLWRVFAPGGHPSQVSGTERDHEDLLRQLVGGLGLLASLVFVVSTGGQSYSHIEGFSSTTTVDQIIHEIRQLSGVYVFLYFHARGRGRVTARERYLALATFGVYAVIFAASSSKGIAIELIALWLLGNAAGAKRGKISREFAIGAVAMAIIYFVFYFVTAYRVELAAKPLNPNAATFEVLSTQMDAAQAAINSVIEGRELGSEDNPYNVTSMFDRLAYVSAFAMMLDLTNGHSPYENAYASMIVPVFAFLPRDLLDDKVQFFDSGTFAKMLGWAFGGFSTTITGSLFWAWGFEGIVPGMMGLGLLLVISARKGEQDGARGLLWRSVLITLTLSLINIGSSFQSILTTVPRTLLLLLLLLFLSRRIVSVVSPYDPFTTGQRRP